MDFKVSLRFVILSIGVLILIYTVRLTTTEHIINSFSETTSCIWSSTADDDVNTGFRIKDKVALIIDTRYSERLIPLILHYHAILGHDWPIVFYTSEEMMNDHFKAQNRSAKFTQLLDHGRVEMRLLPNEYTWSSREHINLFLSRPWIWDSLAPAKHVLVFQADAVLCGNSHHTVDDFLEWDFVGAPLHNTWHVYNGGLSLRNRTMMMDILNEGNSWEEETKSGKWTKGGEDIWFSDKMDQRGGHMPSFQEAVQFSCQHTWHINVEKTPFGYHKVHKAAPKKLDEISKYCPEIALTARGTLPG